MKKSSFLKHFCVYTTFSGRKIMGVPRFDGRVSVSEGKTLSTVQTNGAFPLRGDSPRCGEMAEGQKGRKVVSEANQKRWRRRKSHPGPAPSSVACGDSLFGGAPSAFIPLARECAAGAFLFRAHSPRGSLRQSAPHHPKLHPCAQKGRLIRQTAIHLLKSKSICIAADFVLW